MNVTVPQVLNGYSVIAALPDHDGLIVLVHRPEHEVHKYVTAYWAPHLGTSWYSSTYCATLDEGLASLVKRAGLDQ